MSEKPVPYLMHMIDCPVGGNFGCTCGAEQAAMERLGNAIQAFSRLTAMTPQQLVNLALAHMPEMPYAYEQVIEELCTRVYPNWSNEDPTEASDAGEQ